MAFSESALGQSDKTQALPVKVPFYWVFRVEVYAPNQKTRVDGSMKTAKLDLNK